MARGRMWIDDVSLTKASGNPQAQIQPMLVANAFARTASAKEKEDLSGHFTVVSPGFHILRSRHLCRRMLSP